jgi:protein O-GlcNAc transferase
LPQVAEQTRRDRQNSRRAAGITRTVNAGFAHHQAGRLDRAAALYWNALQREPEHAEALHLLGVVAYQQEKFQSAIELIGRALPGLDDLPEAHLNLGNALRKTDRLAEAIDSYRRAIALDPDYGMAHANLAGVLNDQGLYEVGLESSSRAIELIPEFLGAHANYAAALLGLGRFAEAEGPLRRAVELAPNKPEAHRDLGMVLAQIGRFDEAVMSFYQALAIDPDFVPAHLSLGNVLKTRGELGDAVACFERGAAVDPDDTDVLTVWFRERQNICDWSDYRESEAKVRRAIGAQPSLGAAFTLLALSSTPQEQLDCARRAAAKIAVRETAILGRSRPRPGDRIRLGYLSADFHQHPVSSLIAELIERHDRRRFEIFGYSYGPDERTAMHARLGSAFDRFVKVNKTPHRQAAALIHSDAVDILIDLTGYTGECRPAILACRPAPIQVNYLGYPGTMGAGFIDYIIVDRFLVPSDQQPFYTERLVHLPNCYQPGDTRRQIAEHTPSRSACGLPEESFIFCCLNNTYKITPAFFDIWMRLLRAVPASVLWLLEANVLVKENLRREAADRGVAAERLIFAPRMAMPDYLARLRLADLFLDTLPYNAGATANDALWVGLPVLTCAGATYVGRMAGALLTAVGLPELIATSLDEYEAIALRLATQPSLLAGLRQKLARNRSTMPLFDIARFTRDLEAAYTQMWEIWRSRRPPIASSVSPSTTAAR